MSAGTSGTLDRWYVSGPLGIGTDPSKALDVVGQGLFRSAPWTGPVAGTAGTVVGYDPANAGGTGFLWSQAAGGASTRLWLDGNPIIFAPGGAERLRIDSAGNVGIGTPAPSHKLHVADVTGIRQNRLYLGGGDGWSGLSYNAYHNAANNGWVFPDQARPAVTVELDDSGGNPRFEVYTTTPAAKTAWRRRLRIDGTTGNVWLGEAEGNVGIGIGANPQAKLHVGGGAVIGGVSVGADVPGIDYQFEYESIGVTQSNYNLRLQSPNSIVFHTAGTPRLSIDNGGNANLGTPGGNIMLTVGAGGNGSIKVRHIDGKHYQNDSYEGLYLNWANGMPVQIGGGGPPTPLTVSGDVSVNGRLFLRNIRSWITGFDGGVNNGYHWIKSIEDESRMWMGFVMVNGIPTRIELGPPMYARVYAPSDARLKSDVEPLTGVLEKVGQLRGVSFLRNGQAPAGSARREVGVLAQEVEALFPELVVPYGVDDLKAVDYAGLTGLLLEAVKELRTREQVLARRVAALEGCPES